jgi:hypothetical protein
MSKTFIDRRETMTMEAVLVRGFFSIPRFVRTHNSGEPLQ